MPKTAIQEHPIHKPEEVKKDAELFDKLVKLTPRNYFGAMVTYSDREHVAGFWLETIRQNLAGKKELRLDKRTLPETVEWRKTLFLNRFYGKMYFKKFAKMLANELKKNQNGLWLPVGLILKKDPDGYYISRT